MTASILRGIATFTVLMILGTTVSGTVSAGTMYSVTDLGTGFHLDQNATGNYNGVTASTGLSYTFDKTYVDTNVSGIYNTSSNSRVWASNAFGSIVFNVVSNGGYQESIESGNIHWTLSDTRPPGEDFNIFGQVVGSTQTITSGYSGILAQQFATLSDTNFMSHPGATAYADSSTDNLNHYIASNLGIYLDIAFFIDDQGRIISEGIENDQVHFFLLSPNGLSTSPIPNPEPIPEPSTLAVLIVGLMALAVQTAHRRKVKLETIAA